MPSHVAWRSGSNPTHLASLHRDSLTHTSRPLVVHTSATDYLSNYFSHVSIRVFFSVHITSTSVVIRNPKQRSLRRAMRLINTSTLRLKEFPSHNPPRYAILSNTWGRPDEEISFDDMTADLRIAKSKPAFSKLKYACDEARRCELE